MKKNLFTPKLTEIIAPGISHEYLKTLNVNSSGRNTEMKNMININLITNRNQKNQTLLSTIKTKPENQIKE